MKKIEQFNKKNRKATLPNITSPDMTDICEVIDECPDGTYPVVMEDCVNKSLDEIHRDVSENDKENSFFLSFVIGLRTRMACPNF